MLIALDYDETYTRDPEMWDDFIHNARKRDHEIICVTMRSPLMGCPILGVRVYFTSYQNKWDYMWEKWKIKPDIWIDDSPHFILNNANGYKAS